MNRQIDVEQLYAKFGPTIYARCKRLLKDSSSAEDATQDVFMKVMKHIASAPGEDAVLPWIHRITTNHCLNVIRDSKRHAEPVEHVPEMVDDEFEDSVVTRDFAARVLASTPDELRAPAVMYHARGIEQARVAEVLGVSRRTVLYRLAEFTKRAMRLHEIAEA
jgi:RNA polymerase sigma-70 factor (ECF subfamily)